jgi:hypothetical protein
MLLTVPDLTAAMDTMLDIAEIAVGLKVVIAVVVKV